MSLAEQAVQELVDLYAEIDGETQRLSAHFADRLKCGPGCSDCCQDGLTVFEVEAESIRLHCGDVLSGQKPGAEGACALLEDHSGRCRIYQHRPYVCRTQGLPLRWLDENERGEIQEHRDICPLNAAFEPLSDLPERYLWTIGPFELRLQKIQELFSGGGQKRVALRDLFSG